MLTNEQRRRLGELRSGVDLSPEERRELEGLQEFALEQVFGKIEEDFLLIEDSGGGRIIPHSEAAKNVMPAEMVPRDRELFIRIVNDLERQGYTFHRRKAA